MKKIISILFFITYFLFPGKLLSQNEDSSAGFSSFYAKYGIEEVPSDSADTAFYKIKIRTFQWTGNIDTTGGKPTYTLRARINYYGAYFAGRNHGHLEKKTALRRLELYVRTSHATLLNKYGSRIKGFTATFSSPDKPKSSNEVVLTSHSYKLSHAMKRYIRKHWVTKVVFSDIEFILPLYDAYYYNITNNTITLPSISVLIRERRKTHKNQKTDGERLNPRALVTK